MDTRAFEKGLKLLDQRFRAGKATPEDTAFIYYERLKHIPSRQFLEICEGLIDDMRTFPSPGDIKRGWYAYLQRHPEKKAKLDKVACGSCWDNDGFIFARKLVKGLNREYSYVFRCGDCFNWQDTAGQGIPRLTPEEIEERGYKIEIPEIWNKDTVTSLDELPKPKSIPSLREPTWDDAKEQLDKLKEYCEQEDIPF